MPRSLRDSFLLLCSERRETEGNFSGVWLTLNGFKPPSHHHMSHDDNRVSKGRRRRAFCSAETKPMLMMGMTEMSCCDCWLWNIWQCYGLSLSFLFSSSSVWGPVSLKGQIKFDQPVPLISDALLWPSTTSLWWHAKHCTHYWPQVQRLLGNSRGAGS